MSDARGTVMRQVLVLGLAMCVLAFLPRSMQLAERFTLPKELILHAFALAGVIVLMMRNGSWRFDALDAAVVLFTVLGWVSVFGSRNPWEGFRAASLATATALLFLTARVDGEGERNAIAISMCIACALLATTVCLEAFGIVGHLSLAGRAPGGTMGNRNNAAHLLALGIPVLWYATSIDQLALVRRTLYVAVALSSAAIVLSRSRAAWLAGLMILGGIGYELLSRRRARFVGRRYRGFLAACSLGAVVAIVVPSALTFRDGYAHTLLRIVDFKSGTGRGRLIQYRNTAKMAIDYPVLGVGPRNWQAHYATYATRDDPSYHESSTLTPVDATPQSDWLAVFAERGTPALVLLVVVAWILLNDSVRAARWTNKPPERERGVALLLSLSALSILGALDLVLTLPAGAYMSALVIAIFAPPRSHSHTAAFGRRFRIAFAIVAAVITSLAITVTVRRIYARHLSGHWYNSTLMPERLEAAVRFEPGNLEQRVLVVRAWVAAGRCDRAEPHLAVLDRYHPGLPTANELREVCARGGSTAR